MKKIFLILLFALTAQFAKAQNYQVPEFQINGRAYICKPRQYAYSASVGNAQNQAYTSAGGLDGVSECEFQLIFKNRTLLQNKIRQVFSIARYQELAAQQTYMTIRVFAPKNTGVIQEVYFIINKNSLLTYAELYALDEAIKGLDLLDPVPNCSYLYLNSTIDWDFR